MTLQCHSEGFPTPSITWYKDGKPLNESVRQRVLSTGALQVTFAQPGDMGRYTCTAANVAGSISLAMSLTVQSELVLKFCLHYFVKNHYSQNLGNITTYLSLALVPPSIRSGESEMSVVENTQALLSCVVEGVPQPTVTWEKDGLQVTDTIGEYTILPTGELLIDAAQVRF